jgi:hypothetical protein
METRKDAARSADRRVAMVCPHYATMTLARKNRRVAGHVPILLIDWPLPSSLLGGNGVASDVKDAEPA